MIVALKDNLQKRYVVYALYWGSNFKTYQRYHYVIEPNDGVGGFSPLGEDEVLVIDGSLTDYFLIEKESGAGDVFVHKAALPVEDLFHDLAENGHPEKVKQLIQNMRNMGLEPFPHILPET